jgi:hypothetical protein
MKRLLTTLAILFAFVANMQAQVQADSTLDVISCNPFNPEDTLGQIVWNLANDYERFGHFGKIEERSARKEYIKQFKTLFAPNTMLPNDLEGFEQLVQQLSIEKYVEKAATKGYQEYTLISERGTFTASRQDSAEDYIGYARVFKVFSDTARLDKEYERGVMYEFEIRINTDSLSGQISNITLLDNKIYSNFMMAGFGYQGNSRMLVSNNLNKLVKYKEPEKPKVPKWTKSGFFLHGGYLFTNYLSPESFRNNLNQSTSFTGEEYGYVAGLQYQKVYGDQGVFGILFGVEMEINYYDFNHNALKFDYFTDCDGNALVDLEGGPYDKREVNVSSYQESGEITYIRPEIGLFLNLGLGRAANLQLFGTVGNAFVFESKYDATVLVSYTGYQNGIENPIQDQPNLGFYKDLEVPFSGEHQSLQNFMFYRLGATLDFRLANWLAFSVLAEYRGAMTYAMRFREFNCAFLDPADERTFVTQFDQLSSSRLYNAVGIQAGFKIFIKEKKR